ncbi:MAG: hypothetical protein P4M00_07005 [Azospirillaceae bacterium]|nr:hypothetical protein [Azospirillaceae bacterium]
MTETVLVRDFCDADRASLRDLYQATWTATYGPTFRRMAVTAMLNDPDATDLKNILPGQDGRAAVAVAEGFLASSAAVREHG